MTKLEAFLPRLLPWVNGCPQALAEEKLVDSAIAFCEHSSIVQVTSDPMPVVPGKNEFDLDMDVGTTLSRVLRAWYGPETHHVTGPARIDVQAPGTLIVLPVPAQATTLTVRFSTKPLRTAKSLADVLMQDWVEGIVAGAVYRLSTIPDQAFSSDTNAAKAIAVYNREVGLAKVESTKGRLRTDTRVQMRPFA